ncbi:MAG TPA: DUF2157 domain-containing protein [Polyangia bacterium]|nr:DUF2157 domain-containing protein [Polyangia bacterium]
MEITRKDLEELAADGVLTAAQADAVWLALERRRAAAPAPAEGEVRPLTEAQAPPRPRFDLVHVAYYFGALIVIGAMGWFMNLGWERFGGFGIFAISVAYAVCFVLAGRTLWHRENLKIPGGLLFTMAVSMTPLATYGLERWLGLWPQSDPGAYRDFHMWVKGGWFLMEVATIAAGLVALKFIRFPFLTAPIAFVLWYMSMDLAPLLYGKDPSWNERAWVSAAVGLAMLLASFLIDRRTRQDFAFWGYLFGLLAFWGGLSSMDSDSQLRKFLYCMLNVGLMFASVLLNRRVFVIFGALGVSGYLGFLAHDVFRDSLWFPFVLSFLGIAIIFAGVQYHKRQAQVRASLLHLVPEWARKRLPS